MRKLHVVVIGSGPNGLAAALTLARSSLSVLVVEAGEVQTLPVRARIVKEIRACKSY